MTKTNSYNRLFSEVTINSTTAYSSGALLFIMFYYNIIYDRATMQELLCCVLCMCMQIACVRSNIII